MFNFKQNTNDLLCILFKCLYFCLKITKLFFCLICYGANCDPMEL